MTVPVVFDLETGGEPFPLGRYDHTDEDAVIYYTAAGDRRMAPCDCVQIVEVDVFAPAVALLKGAKP